MKKLLAALSSITFICSSSSSLIACSHDNSGGIAPSPKSDKDISKDITNLDSINNKLYIHETSKYKDFNENILNSIELFKLVPKITGTLKIQYFDKDLIKDLTDSVASTTETKVVISISNDKYFTGKTLPLNLNFIASKLNLSVHLTSLDSLGTITVTPGQSNNSLKSIITNSKEFLALTPKLKYFDIQYFDKPNGNYITNNYQKEGTIYAVIEVSDTNKEKNYEGQTNPLAITLGKAPINKIITKLNGPEGMPLDYLSTFAYLDNSVMHSSQILDLVNPLASGYKIHYFDKPNGQDITNLKQDRTKFYIQITTSKNDPIYKGSTDFILINLGKLQISEYLHTLQISSVKLTVNPQLKFKDLDNQIRNDWYIKQLPFPLKNNFVINYYKDKNMTYEITNDCQTVRTFYITITPAENDPIYQGITSLFELSFNQANLYDLITNLDSFQDKVNPFDPNKRWSDLDQTVKQASQFKTIENNLRYGYKIRYYSDSECKNDITNEKQNMNLFFIVITPDWTDPNYTGSTRPIPFWLGKMDLSQQLTNLDQISNNIKANNESTYKDLWNPISSQVSFFNNKINPNYSPGWTIKYYSDSDCKNQITNNNQISGEVWITFEAMKENFKYKGITQPLKITLL